MVGHGRTRFWHSDLLCAGLAVSAAENASDFLLLPFHFTCLPHMRSGKKFFAYGNMTVVLGETVVTLIVAQLMCVFIGGMDEWRSRGGGGGWGWDA